MPAGGTPTTLTHPDEVCICPFVLVNFPPVGSFCVQVHGCCDNLAEDGWGVSTGDTLAVPNLETLLDEPVFKEGAQGLYGK